MFKVANHVFFLLCIGFCVFGLQIQNNNCSFKKKLNLKLGGGFNFNVIEILEKRESKL